MIMRTSSLLAITQAIATRQARFRVVKTSTETYRQTDRQTDSNDDSSSYWTVNRLSISLLNLVPISLVNVTLNSLLNLIAIFY